ncbi:hypothetical protein [Metaplanococcus flavidus]|uniref:Uncharacterized protein n=1 Tax=Metaplanococcus flavidus TaxID=569883 RepID=A0ABW3LF66_9BACL
MKKMKKYLMSFLVATLVFAVFSFTGSNPASAMPGFCEINSVPSPTVSVMNASELKTEFQEEKFLVIEDGDISIQGCSGVGIKRATSYQISKTGRNEHQIKGEYDRGSSFDLYVVTKTGQVVIVHVAKRIITDWTDYFTK